MMISVQDYMQIKDYVYHICIHSNTTIITIPSFQIYSHLNNNHARRSEIVVHNLRTWLLFTSLSLFY